MNLAHYTIEQLKQMSKEVLQKAFDEEVQSVYLDELNRLKYNKSLSQNDCQNIVSYFANKRYVMKELNLEYKYKKLEKELLTYR